jgi:tripartite-type tricarboxylate transporter receptor subunit TctC
MIFNVRGITLLFSILWNGLVIGQTTNVDPVNNYPNKPIRIIIPLAAGNSIDSAVRILTQKMSQSMGQSFVIETLPGAAGIIGTDKVAKSPPDGYTLGAFNDSILTMVPNFPNKIPWDPIKDFDPISLVALIELGLVVSPNASEKTAADLIASAKLFTRPDQLWFRRQWQPSTCSYGIV